MRLIALTALICLAVAPAMAKDTVGEKTIALYYDLNATCRGSAGVASNTACEARAKVSDLLKTMNYCFGKKGQYGGEMNWQRCGPDSLR